MTSTAISWKVGRRGTRFLIFFPTEQKELLEFGPWLNVSIAKY